MINFASTKLKVLQSLGKGSVSAMLTGHSLLPVLSVTHKMGFGCGILQQDRTPCWAGSAT